MFKMEWTSQVYNSFTGSKKYYIKIKICNSSRIGKTLGQYLDLRIAKKKCSYFDFSNVVPKVLIAFFSNVIL